MADLLPGESYGPLTFDQFVTMMTSQFLASEEESERAVTVDDVAEGAVIRSIFEGVAVPLEELSAGIAVDLPTKYFWTDATGGNLDRIITNQTLGKVVRVEAEYGAGDLRYEGTAGAVVPAGSAWKTDGGLQVSNLVQVAIAVGDTSVTGAAQARVKGLSGNLLAGTVLTPVNPIAGITRAVVTDAWDGGADDQSDDELLTAAIEYLETLTKGTPAAIEYGARAAGYPRAYVTIPGAGRVIVYVDDGQAANPTKMAAAQASITADWAAAGATVTIRSFVEKVVNFDAEAFPAEGASKSTLQAAIAALWASTVFGPKVMGTGLARLELTRAAERAAHYNGLNLYAPAADLAVRAATDLYNTVFGAGQVYPYEKIVLGNITWR